MDFLKQKGPLAREFCNTLIYIISLVSLKPSSLQRVLTELQWNGMWFFSLAFFAVIFMEMLSDFLLVTDRCTAWKALNGNVSEAEFHNLQQIVLCKNQKVSIEKKLASTILLVLMICATAAFVWFTFLAWLNNFGILNRAGYRFAQTAFCPAIGCIKIYIIVHGSAHRASYVFFSHNITS